jgi:putative ABC transport system ATP-binding protein
MSDPVEKSAPPPVIFLDAVHKIYHSGEVDVHAVRGVSLAIAKGEFVAIMGASGSGKSTLMNLLGCLDRPTKGRYLLDGTAVAELNRKQLSILRNHKLGFVFQSFNLLARTTALENVELPLFYSNKFLSLRQQKESALKALEKVGLTDRASHHPSQLSGGQQQRVALARALVNEPEVILADEPTGNLDSRTSIEILGVFQTLNAAGITIVMVTHELDIASYCKRSIIMRDGEILSDEPNLKRHLAADELALLNQRERRVQLA